MIFNIYYVFTIDLRGLSDVFAFFTIKNVDQSLVINSEKRARSACAQDR